jgi:hypothetical protein
MPRNSLRRRASSWLAFEGHNFAEKDADGDWPVCSLAASSSATLGASRKLSQNKSLTITKSPRNTKAPKPRINTPTSRTRITENPRDSSNLLMMRRLIPSPPAGKPISFDKFYRPRRYPAHRSASRSTEASLGQTWSAKDNLSKPVNPSTND